MCQLCCSQLQAGLEEDPRSGWCSSLQGRWKKDCSWLPVAGCRLPSGPCHKIPSILLGQGSMQEQGMEKASKTQVTAFQNLAAQETFHYFRHMLSMRNKPQVQSKLKEKLQSGYSQDGDPWQPCPKLPTTRGVRHMGRMQPQQKWTKRTLGTVQCSGNVIE